MCDNCLNIFPRSTLSFYLFYPSTNKFPPSRFASRKIHILHITSSSSLQILRDAMLKKYSHLYLVSSFFSYSKAGNILFAITSHNVYIQCRWILFHSLSLFDSLHNIQHRSMFIAAFSMETFHNLHTYPPFLAVLPLWTDANRYSCGYFSVIKEKLKGKENI